MSIWHKKFTASIWVFLIIAASNIIFVTALDLRDNSSVLSLAEHPFNKADLSNSPSEADSKRCVTVYYASGETETLQIPFEKYTVSAFSWGNYSNIFVNDLSCGDKIDMQLRNYTMLLQKGYLRDDGRIRVILLTGDCLKPNTYGMRTLNEHEMTILSDFVQSLNGTITSKCKLLPYVSVEVSYENLAFLSRCNTVSYVFLDKRYSVCLSESVPIIKLEERWRQIESYFGYEINGTGIKIAVLDTGIDKTHPDLQNKVILEKCFTDEGKTTDGCGHGTHCASIAAGTGAASNYTYVGVAPGAVLLNGKVLTDYGVGYESWIIQGIEWAVEQDADVISMSFGADINGDGTDPLSMTVNWATDQGAVCVVAAGNAGELGMFTVGIPAVAKKAITVGATTKDDYVVDFSSQGPSADYRLKPDVCAPGVDIIAARAKGTFMGEPINEYYTKASGTSMATPHVAGAAALILQVHPDWSPIMVKSALMGNAKVLPDENLWKQGAGRIDVCNAINATLLITEPSASFGVIELSHSKNVTFTLINIANYAQTVNLSTYTTCENVETNYVHLNVTTLVVPPHGSVPVMMVAGPIDEEAPEGWYEGWFSVNSGIQECRAPYLFIVKTLIKACIYDVDNITRISGFLVLTNYPDMTLVDIQWFDSFHQDITFIVEAGTYSLCAQSAWIESTSTFDFTRMFMIQKVFSVEKFRTVFINLSLAEAFVREIPTVDEEGKNLTVHVYTQYLCGDLVEQKKMWWSTQCSWSGINLNVSKLTLYTTEYSPADELSESIGYYASNSLLTKIYLFNWKFFNLPVLPETITQDYSKLAKYAVYYDMPETYPENGLHIQNAFWFTWEYLGLMQTWGWDIERVYAGINATYYLTPLIAWYWGSYMTTYAGWTEPFLSPMQEWRIVDWERPPYAGETGALTLGRFDFGPYAPGINLHISHVNEKCLIELTGNLWTGLDRPNFILFSYPQTPLPYYYLYVDGELVAHDFLVSYDWFGFVSWEDLSVSWNVTGTRALLQIFMPSLAVISKETMYAIEFSLTENMIIPPFFYDLIMPLNYSPNENITILPKTTTTATFHVTNISLSYSFDETKWYVAEALPSQEFRIPCQASEKLAIRINATDNKGNHFQYYSNPVALCKEVNLNKTVSDPSIIIDATTLDGTPIRYIALKIVTNNVSFYEPLDFMGRVVLPASIGPIIAWFPKVGLYAETLVPKPDIAVVNIKLSRDEVYIGMNMNIYVTVENYGEFPESFSVKVYCNEVFIGSLVVDSLIPKENVTLTFHFNTEELAPYVNYTIKAEAEILPHEFNITNNVLIKGVLRTRAPGDVNGDKKIDVLDIVSISRIYGCKEDSPCWNPLADLAEEWGKIDILDVVTCASHYGEEY